MRRRATLALAALVLATFAVGTCATPPAAPPGEPAALVAQSGDAQQGVAGATLAAELAVRVVDAAGRGVPNVDVAWSPADSTDGDSLLPAATRTDAAGVARAHWSLGARLGAHAADARASALEARFAATARRRVGDWRPDTTGVVVIAHRGFRALFPENTLVALDGALARGADAVEFDVALSRDAVPVLMHDDSVDRTTTGTGLVRQLSAAQLAALDACSKFSAFGTQWAPCPVPTLHQALTVVRGRGRALVDLHGPWPRAALVALLAELRADGMLDDVIVTSFDYATLTTLRSLDAALPLGYVRTTAGEPGAAALGNAAEVIERGALITLGARGPAYVADVDARGGDVAAWVVNGSAAARAMLALGPVRLVTDAPLDKQALRQ